ncbi:hslU, partial [Symbiodinium microadriaticum]
VARRLANLVDAPFVKTDATKYTEVGFVGQDVNEILNDLVVAAMSRARKNMSNEVKVEAEAEAASTIIKGVRTTLRRKQKQLKEKVAEEQAVESEAVTEEGSSAGLAPGGDENVEEEETDALLLARYQAGELDDLVIRVDIPVKKTHEPVGIISFSSESLPSAIKDIDDALLNFLSGSMSVSETRRLLVERITERLLEGSEEEIKQRALEDSQQRGIIFIDEIDKVVANKDSFGSGRDASAEGVQRDLLPIVEGTVVKTKFGNINTEHILFIAAGSFHAAKPSDLLPELQGRLPIRVTLDSLTEKDLHRILTVELMKVEGLELTFTAEAVHEISRIAFEINRTVENIGARRLHTVVEKIMEEISFTASENRNTSFEVTPEHARQRVKEFLHATDLK